MQKISNYINGQLIEPVGETYLNNYEPATGKVYSLIPDSDERDVELAYKAAAAAASLGGGNTRKYRLNKGYHGFKSSKRNKGYRNK
jgi:acyl-CoA reductase-like NAD-dependent aldehyde dehydrogenase